MEAIYEFFCRPEVVQFCYGLLAALPPTLASIISIIVIPIVRKIANAHMDRLNGKESELYEDMKKLAERATNNEIKFAEMMTELTKIKREVEGVKNDSEHTT